MSHLACWIASAIFFADTVRVARAVGKPRPPVTSSWAVCNAVINTMLIATMATYALGRW